MNDDYYYELFFCVYRDTILQWCLSLAMHHFTKKPGRSIAQDMFCLNETTKKCAGVSIITEAFSYGDSGTEFVLLRERLG